MTATQDLAGSWQLCMDAAPCRYDMPPDRYTQNLTLPGTTAQQQLGAPNFSREAGCLTERYPFSGQIWLRKTVRIAPAHIGKPCFLYLERTRMTRLWVNGACIGEEQSLCTPHVYDLTAHTAETMEIVLCIKNTDYPTRGGHMTSIDTQTNWIGVTGRIALDFYAPVYLSNVQVYPDADAATVMLTGRLHGASSAEAVIQLGDETYTALLHADCFSVIVPLPEDTPLWSEYTPHLINLTVTLPEGEQTAVTFGLRAFRAAGDHFEINGIPTMLRGKHDGMVFPLEGAAPTDTESWLQVFRIMKEWGINHYRFHTCCPPDAAFTAADMLGIYMEPELPFWGTVHALDDPECNPEEQAYLLREGLRICSAFGNHPSFCMLSLGNELWGSSERLGEIIGTLRAADPRPLYTQGSNNFQHMPVQIPQEDFWTGVRTGHGKLIRGAFADCDAPIGRIQTHAPSADWDYEAYLVPHDANAADLDADGETELEIQYGTGVKRVRAEKQQADFVPTVPVVTHEIGQYNIYPDYTEIPKYTGVLAARNLVLFRERLEAAGMGGQAADFFRCSGLFARDCYKAELEAAMRSKHIAGFQILDLQDFPGQGTALVGMLNALLENKGLIEPKAWRAFCGDLVPLARFDSFVRTAGASMEIGLAIRNSRPFLPKQSYALTLTCGETVIGETTGEIPESTPGYLPLGRVSFDIPAGTAGSAVLSFSLPESDIENTWQLTILPSAKPVQTDDINIVHSFSEAEPYLQKGGRVLLLPDAVQHAVPGFYCTDFWNYHMFRIISESMGRKIPIGTMGLCMDAAHPIVRAMFGACHSTPQWYGVIMHADCAVLDAAPEGYRPIVQMIDNAERNHRLGLIFEARVSGGSLLVCTVRFQDAPDELGMNRLHHAVTDYIRSDAFHPDTALRIELLRALFG